MKKKRLKSATVENPPNLKRKIVRNILAKPDANEKTAWIRIRSFSSLAIKVLYLQFDAKGRQGV